MRREDLQESMKRLNRRVLARCRCTSGSTSASRRVPTSGRTFAHRRAMVNLGRYPVYSGRITVSGWNVDWTRIRGRYESGPLLEAGAMEFCLAGKPAVPSANE